MDKSSRTVLLFNPRSMRAIGEDSVLPMGLLMASIYLHKKYKVIIVDQRVEKKWKPRLKETLKQKPVCIGITALTGKQITGGLMASRMAKKENCPVVWGGIHASLLPKQTLEHPLVDYVVEGEGEESFPALVDRISQRVSTVNIPGVWSKINGELIFGGERSLIDLNKLSEIPYHLVDLAKYIKPGPYGKTMIAYSSRGCPQRCTFCFNKSFNRSCWRGFSSGRVLEEMRRIKRDYSFINHFEFWDDNFFANLKRAREIAEGIRELHLGITWSALGSHIRDIAHMDGGYLACLRDSAFKEMFVGIESGSQRVIDMVQKNFKMDELFSANRRLGDYGIKPTYSFISGTPDEDDEDIKKTVETMFRLKRENSNIVLGNIKPFMCYPGTALYEKMSKSDFKHPERLEGWSQFVWGNYLSLDVPWVSRKRRWFLAKLYYYTILMSPQYIFIRSKIFTLFASLLRPIAEWRVRNLWFGFPVEAWFMYMAQKILL